ncbi:LysR family transcriptional regulator [Schumannella soli]|uniref:LysR family transcriptional regulator n=1 Tax=Schumannella soli TaxID=2590779 RepID=A0A506XV46_9MICO|nr:LysR family transcriptional regulator [Schumannella soli]TPW74016.1 LysR family transcriptional regulator [Schumannella soli]
MHDLETRELRYFVAVAEELNVTRAAERLGIAQPPLSRAIRQLEQRLEVQLIDRVPSGIRLTSAGEVLLREARAALQAVGAAALRTRRAGVEAETGDRVLTLATKAGSSHELLQAILDANEAAGQTRIEVLLCEIGEQATLLREGAADVAIMHRPFDDLAGFETADLLTEPQVAIVPSSHPLAARSEVTREEVANVPGLPIARWPRLDGSYPEGDGPEVRSQTQLAQLVALGRTLLVIPRSSRAWQWPEHTAVPVVDAPHSTTLLAWPHGHGSADVDRLVATAERVAGLAVALG